MDCPTQSTFGLSIVTARDKIPTGKKTKRPGEGVDYGPQPYGAFRFQSAVLRGRHVSLPPAA